MTFAEEINLQLLGVLVNMINEEEKVIEAKIKQEKEREKMLSIAKPFLLDGCADPMKCETFMTLLSRVDKPEKERGLVGNIILDLMRLTYNNQGDKK